MKFSSCAQWPKGTAEFSNDVTKDENGSWQQANGIATRLRREGFGGDGKIFPLRVWVEDEHGREFPRDPDTLKISPERFVWEKYIGKVGWAVHQVCSDAYTEPLKLNPDVTFIGWCEASRIRIRQRSEGFVVLVEMDGEEFWFHTLALPDFTKQTA
jgi:hypothetical protein